MFPCEPCDSRCHFGDHGRRVVAQAVTVPYAVGVFRRTVLLRFDNLPNSDLRFALMQGAPVKARGRDSHRLTGDARLYRALAEINQKTRKVMRVLANIGDRLACLLEHGFERNFRREKTEVENGSLCINGFCAIGHQ